MSDAVREGLARLQAMSTVALRCEWRRVYKSPPAQFTPDMLLRGLAWRLQKGLSGGLERRVARELERQAMVLRSDGARAKGSRQAIKAGTRLVRSWQGVTHSVLALEEGFEYQGKHYRSLSAIAEVITGTRWSGPRFFGLSQKGPS